MSNTQEPPKHGATITRNLFEMAAAQEPKAPRPAAIVCDGPGMSGGAIVRWAGSAMPCPPETPLVTLDAAIAYAEALAAHRVAQERERWRGYFRDALSDHGVTWPGEVDILYDKCFGASYVPDEAT